MKKQVPPLLLILCLTVVTACNSSNPPPTSNLAPVTTPIITPLPSVAMSPSATTTPVPRSAAFSEIENTVEARPQGTSSFAPASVGETLAAGGEARSGDNSRARLDLLPEGSIVRIGPNSNFVLEEIGKDPASPSTRLKLLLGQIWIILNGGSLEVETSNGVAAVRGSYLSVSFQNETTLITCLEGSCTLENALGKVELTNGEMASITGNNLPEGPFPMNQGEFNQWFANALEAWNLLKSGNYTPPNGLITPPACLICTPGYYLTVVPATRTPLLPTHPTLNIPTIIPTLQFPHP